MRGGNGAEEMTPEQRAWEIVNSTTSEQHDVALKQIREAIAQERAECARWVHKHVIGWSTPEYNCDTGERAAAALLEARKNR